MKRPLTLYWFLPLEPDVKFIGTWPPEGPQPTFRYLTSVVIASEDAGFTGLLVRTGYAAHYETWLISATLLARTRQARLIVAVRPNQYHPAQAAKMGATLQNLFPGRLELNVVSGGTDEDKWLGNYDDRDTRYRRVREWLEIVEGIWHGRSPFSYQGQIYQVEDMTLYPELSQPISIFFSGNAPEAKEISAKHAHTHLIHGAPLEDVAREIDSVRAVAKKNRKLRFGLRIHVIVRETEGHAWKAADRLISQVDPRISAALLKQPPNQAANSPPARQSLIIGPNLWAGVGTARLGVPTALVGNPQQIVDRLMEYRSLGIDTFILSSYPKLGEVRRFGKLVSPLLRKAGVLGH